MTFVPVGGPFLVPLVSTIEPVIQTNPLHTLPGSIHGTLVHGQLQTLCSYPSILKNLDHMQAFHPPTTPKLFGWVNDDPNSPSYKCVKCDCFAGYWRTKSSKRESIVELQCGNPRCGNIWYICVQCSSFRCGQMKNSNTAYRHWSRQHRGDSSFLATTETPAERFEETTNDGSLLPALERDPADGADSAMPNVGGEEYSETVFEASIDMEEIDIGSVTDDCDNSGPIPYKYEDVGDLVPTPHHENFLNDQSERYFRHALRLGDDTALGGNIFMSVQSQQQTYVAPAGARLGWDNDEAELSRLIAELCLDLSAPNQKKLVRVFDLVCRQRDKLHKLEKSGDDRFLPLPSLPRDYAQLRSMITDGKFSYHDNLPHPPWYFLGDVSFLRIIECIQDFKAHGVPHGVIHDNSGHQADWCTHFLNSPEAKRILSRAKAIFPSIEGDNVLLLILWEDDYESNYNKTERGTGVFKQALTIVGPPLNSANPSPQLYTYPLIIGPKSSKHYHEIHEIHRKELQRLCTSENPVTVFCRQTSEREGRVVRVQIYAEVLLSLQDQPQRRKSNQLSRGNSRFHARFGFSFDFENNVNRVPSCHECRNRNKSNLPEQPCGRCCSWFIDEDKHAISYQQLVEAATEVHKGIVQGTVDSKAGHLRLQELCIEKTMIDVIIDHALNIAVYDELESENRLETDYPHLAYLREVRPEEFVMANLPSTWTQYQWAVWKNIDVPMHLIFLGIVKTSMGVVDFWLKHMHLKTAFVDRVDGLMTPIEKMALSWAKAREYGRTGKFGGKVSENFVCDARMLPWIYSCIGDIEESFDFKEPKNVPPARWNRKVNEAWLKARGIPVGKGDASKIKEKVEYYMNLQGGPPPIIPAKGAPVATVLHMVGCLTALVYLLMMPTTNSDHQSAVKRHIRLFLDSFEDVDSVRRDKKIGEPSVDDSLRLQQEGVVPEPASTKPNATEGIDESDDDTTDVSERGEEDEGAVQNGPPDHILDNIPSPSNKPSQKIRPRWLTSYNFLCLPNMVKVIERFGPLRYLWEGGWVGEANISDSKHATTRTGSRSRDGWAKNQMKRELKVGAMRRMFPKLSYDLVEDDMEVLEDDDEVPPPTEAVMRDKKMVHRYPKESDVLIAIADRIPLSCVKYRSDSRLWCRVKQGGFEIPLNVGHAIVDRVGFKYFDILANTDGARPIASQEPCDVRYCLALPLTVHDGTPYAVIDSEWHVMTGRNQFQMYRVPGVVYSTVL